MFSLKTFGGLSLIGDAGPVTGAPAQRRKLALVAVLATTGQQGLSRDRLLALFWPEADAEHARHALTQSLFALRRELGVDDLVLGQADVRLNPAAINSDVGDFAAALAGGDFERAAGLYAGPFLDGVHLDRAHHSPEFDRWVEAERRRLAELAAAAMERVATDASARGDHAEAVAWWRRLATIDPYSSRYAVGLIRALVAAGDTPSALRHAHVYETLVREELNVEPDGAVLAAVRALRPASGAGSEATSIQKVPSEARPSGAASPPPRRGARWVRGALAVGVGAAAVLIGAVLTFRGTNSPRLDPDLVAVAPFQVLEPKLELWREGLVDILARNLDGAGPLRTVSPTVAIRRWSGRADPASATTLGRRTGARLAVFGSVLATGQDSVRLTAAVVDVVTSRVLGEVELQDSTSRMDRLADSVTVALLRELNRTRPVAAVRFSSVGSRSHPALKAFLLGEQFYRRSTWDSAIAYYQRAITLDSTFAPALRHLSKAREYQVGAVDSVSSAYAVRSAAFNRGLAPRESLLILADSLYAALSGFASDPDWWAHSRREFATLAEAARRYPDDPETWYELAEAQWNFGYWRGITEQQILDAVDRAVALDSAFAPAWIDGVEHALRLKGPVEARRYAANYLALNPSGLNAEAVGLAVRLLDPAQARSRAVAHRLDTASADVLSYAWVLLQSWPDVDESALKLMQLATDGRRASLFFLSDSLLRQRFLGAALAYRGHLREAYRVVGNREPFLFAELALVSGIPADAAGAQFRRWVTEGHLGAAAHGLPLLATRGDGLSIQRFIRREDSLARFGSERVERVRGLYQGARGRAYLALARHDTSEALRQFAALPDSLCGGCFEGPAWDRVTRAQLLVARGRQAEAARLLELYIPAFPRPLSVVAMLERGRVADKIGNRDKAIAAYRFVVDVWLRADSVLQPYVADARARLKQLGAERR